mmetsp:Transcript_44827/g.74399  ORF Transcript_44827/g.74399 Transcript_44827/m.74399 type:complete len:333 (+) Transcript_44827:90-1088(+)
MQVVTLLPHGALRLAVTGAAGYLGAEIACLAASQGHYVRAVVKEGQHSNHLIAGTLGQGHQCCSEVLRVQDLCEFNAALAVAEGMDAVLHAAAVFRKCDDMERKLVLPNIRIAEQMVKACAACGSRLVLTSSMAAVRGTGQAPLNGKTFTRYDWNTVSKRDGADFEPYQFSKAESERCAWELSRRLGCEMVSICPSMIFGPPRDGCTGLSVAMVQRWADGAAPVQNRLVVDVRDCAQSHINAAMRPCAAGKRYITSCEARVSAHECAEVLRRRLLQLGRAEDAACITADMDFEGGAIPIGEREVDVSHLAELGVTCRPSTTTLRDMAEALLT